MTLELVSTKDLISEIQKRSTFLGIIIWSPKETTNEKSNPVSDLNIFSAFDSKGTTRILSVAHQKVSQEC